MLEDEPEARRDAAGQGPVLDQARAQSKLAGMVLRRGMLRIAGTMIVALGFTGTSAFGAGLPAEIVEQAPHGYVVLAAASSMPAPGHRFYLVALALQMEPVTALSGRAPAPARPLLIFEADPSGHYVLVGRNDDVVLRADDAGLAGNGCDPFEDHHIAVKGAFFTVEGGVSCGAHWTDYVTFRFDPRTDGYIFNNWRAQSWKSNPSENPAADALIPEKPLLVRATKDHPIRFETWRRPERYFKR